MEEIASPLFGAPAFQSTSLGGEEELFMPDPEPGAEPLLRITENGQAVARLEGEVDISNVAELREVLERAAGSGGDVSLDLSGLTFIDVGGIRALYQTAHRLGEDGRVLTLVSPPAMLTRMLSVVGLDRLESLRVPEGGEPD